MSPLTFCIVWGLAVLGAVGLYGLLPRDGRRWGALAGVILAASGIGLALLGIRRVEHWDIREYYFWCFAVPAVWAAVRVITHRRPVYSAVYFLLLIVAIAGEAALANAEFLAAALIIIYAGAILVTYVFVIMMVQQNQAAEYDLVAREPLAAVLVAMVLTVCIAQLVSEPSGAIQPAGPEISAAAEASKNHVQNMAGVLFTRYAVAMEIAGMLLWVAIVGAIWLVSRPTPADADRSAKPGPPPGQIGRELPPF